MAEVTDHSGDQNTNTNSQDIRNYGVPPMVVYLLAAFLMVVFLVAVFSVWQVGQLSAQVSALNGEIAGFKVQKAVATLEETRRLEDQLRADLAERDAEILFIKSQEN